MEARDESTHKDTFYLLLYMEKRHFSSVSLFGHFHFLYFFPLMAQKNILVLTVLQQLAAVGLAVALTVVQALALKWHWH